MRTDSFSALLRVSGPVFIFCAAGLVFGGTEGVRSRFHVLRARTHFRRYRQRQLSFSCFAFLDSFSAVLRVPDPVFMFCAPGHVFGGTEGVRSQFHVLRSRLIFGGTEVVGSRFHVLHVRTRFRRYRVRQVPFSCFALPN
jgi:hypothetical protein